MSVQSAEVSALCLVYSIDLHLQLQEEEEEEEEEEGEQRLQ